MRLFYSWQSDHKENTTVVRKSLQKICKEFDIEYTEDTRDATGSENIVDVILSKIKNSDIFVGDVSIVGETSQGKKLVNPNVSFELGYAHDRIGRDRILLIVNEDYGSYKEMFDIASRMVCKFSLESETPEEIHKYLRKKIAMMVSKGKHISITELSKREKDLLFWSHKIGDDYISIVPTSFNAKLRRGVATGLAEASPEGGGILYLNVLNDYKTEQYYIRAINQLVDKGMISIFPKQSLSVGPVYLLTEEAQQVAEEIQDDEVNIPSDDLD